MNDKREEMNVAAGDFLSAEYNADGQSSRQLMVSFALEQTAAITERLNKVIKERDAYREGLGLADRFAAEVKYYASRHDISCDCDMCLIFDAMEDYHTKAQSILDKHKREGE